MTFIKYLINYTEIFSTLSCRSCSDKVAASPLLSSPLVSTEDYLSLLTSACPGREWNLAAVLLTSLLGRRKNRERVHMVRDMTGHSLQFSFHGDDQLQTCLALTDVSPDLPEDDQTGAGVLSRQASQVSAVLVSVERLALRH